MSYKHLRQNIPTLVLAAVALVLTVPKHLGFVLFFLSPFIIIALIYNAIAAIRVPDNRKLHLTRIAIWLIVPLVAAIAQFYWFATTRATANAIVVAVTKHKDQNGTWPASLEEIGVEVSNRDFREPYGYEIRGGKPSLAYEATDALIDTYEYDFEEQKWVFYSH